MKMRIGVLLLCVGLGAADARAEIIYSWSGYAERSEGGNDPFGFGGDGSRNTLFDGTPFSIEISISRDAEDAYADSTDPFTDNRALFFADAVNLTIGGTNATFSSSPGPSILLDERNIPFDAFLFRSLMTFNGHTGFWAASAFADPSTFDLDDGVGADPPVVFGEIPNQTTSGVNNVDFRTFIIEGSIISSVAVPEPTTCFLLLAVTASIGSSRRPRKP